MSLQIRKHFESDQKESWEQGLLLFHQPPEGVEFWKSVYSAVVKQVARCGVRRENVEESPLYATFLDQAMDLVKPTQALAEFMRRYENDNEYTIWDHVFHGRIKPCLIGYARDERRKPKPGFFNSDSDFDMKASTAGEPEVADDESQFDELLNQALDGLGPNHREIFLLDVWVLFSDRQKNRYREEIVSTGAANRKTEAIGKSESERYALTIEEFLRGEAKLRLNQQQEQQKLVAIEETLTEHYCAAEINGQKKKLQAKRFSNLGGLNEVASHTQVRGVLRSSKIPEAWFNSIKLVLFEICHLAAETSARKEFNRIFHTYFPLAAVYPGYEAAKKGPPKKRIESLATLKEFGILCQSQSSHFRTYLNQARDRESLKSSLGMDDKSIATILALSISNVRTMRHRRKRRAEIDLTHLANQLAHPTAQAPAEVESHVCSEYKLD
jgi:hypothetical protein